MLLDMSTTTKTQTNTIVNENDYLNALDEEIQENSKWVKISPGEVKRLLFMLREKPQYKEDTYMGQPTGVWKTFYTVIDINSSIQKEKIFKANTASTRLINTALRESHLLDIRHEGSGSNTIYRPTVVFEEEEENESE
jgi:hypothetical protein